MHAVLLDCAGLKRRAQPLLVAAIALGVFLPTKAAAAASGLRAGAAAVDVTPSTFPVRVNGGMLERKAERVTDRLHARALVLDDGTTPMALCVVDSCMLPRDLIDVAKERAAAATGIPTARMLVSATHTHSAPSAMGALGADAEPAYVSWLAEKIAEAIAIAARQREAARAGWISVDAWSLTHTRRWIRRPDRMIVDPFGVMSVRANMHPGHESPDVTGPSGPNDPELSLLSVQTRDGRPLALLANFSQHYKSGAPLSADYAGRFAEGIGALLGAGAGFVGIFSQGTSGDSMWMDYSQPKKDVSLDEYAAELLRIAAEAAGRIAYKEIISLAMSEAKLTLRRRVPDEARLAWAKGVVDAMGARKVPIDRTEVYAREQLILAAEPERELKLQAARIGDLGITALPNEVYAITGLKLKALSPLRATFNIGLANGSEGYIPPPEQHRLGGYTTWAARTAGLEEQAEPRIVETLVQLLEQIAATKRRVPVDSHGAYSEAVMASQPLAYWRLNEITPARGIIDATGHGRSGHYEGGVAVFLPGVQSRSEGDAISAVPESSGPFSKGQINRAPHLAGGRIQSGFPLTGRSYSVEMWVWNGLPEDARAVTGHLFSRGVTRDILGVGGSAANPPPGRLFFRAGKSDAGTLNGRTPMRIRQWYHVALVREDAHVKVYLDGALELEGRTEAVNDDSAVFSVGGDGSNIANFEGRVDEVSVYNRALRPEEIRAHFAASGRGH